MPKGTDDHVGFFCPQSKQTFSSLVFLHSDAWRPYLIGGLRLQLLKYFLRLTLSSEAHTGMYGGPRDDSVLRAQPEIMVVWTGAKPN